MLTRIGVLLLVTGATLMFAPWVAMAAAVGGPMMIVGALVLAVSIEQTLDASHSATARAPMSEVPAHEANAA